MAGIVEIAKEAGLNPVKCPHCGHNIRTGSLVFVRLFRTILERVKSGEDVIILGFGIFRRAIKPPYVNSPRMRKFEGKKALDTGGQEVGPVVRVAFKQSRVAKAFLNKKEDQ